MSKKRKRLPVCDKVALETQLVDQMQDLLEGGSFVTIVTGAGISVSSGIPPYRGASNSVWETSVKDWGTRSKFLEDPLKWYNSFWLPKFATEKVLKAKPNETHFSISSLQNAYKTLLVITQNMDCLHNMSGSPSDQLIQIHGQLGLYKCTNTKKSCTHSDTSTISYTPEYIASLTSKNPIRQSDRPKRNKAKRNTQEMKISCKWKRIPTCPLCDSPTMPLTLMFDEDYESHKFYQSNTAAEWLEKSKLVLFAGTSHAVNITRIAEQIGYSNSIPLYNINLRDSVNGMINIHTKAEILFPSLCSQLLNNLSQNLLDSPKRQKNTNPLWSVVPADQREKFKNSRIVNQLFFNRALSLCTIYHVNQGNLFKYEKSPGNVQEPEISDALLSISHCGIGSVMGDILDDFGDEMYEFFNSIIPQEANCLWLMLDSYSHPIDDNISLRNIPRITSIPSIPRHVLSFLKRKESAEKQENSNLKLVRPPVLTLDLFMGFCFDKEKFCALSSKNFGVQVSSDEVYRYVGKATNRHRPLFLVEMSDEVLDIYIKNIHPWLHIIYKTPAEFRAAGGIAMCILNSLNCAPTEDNIISACVSTFIADGCHHADAYSHPDHSRRGLALACSYSFIHRCLLLDQIPDWSCSTQAVAPLRMAFKLAFIPVSIIPALYRDKSD